MAQPMPQAAGPEQGDPAEVLREMIVSTDQALTQIGQIIGKQIPEAGEALMQLSEQFRGIIEQVMSGGGRGGARQAPEQAPAEMGGARGARQAM